MHSDRLKQSFSTSHHVSPLTERAEDEAVREPAPEDPSKSLVNVLSDKMDYIAAAMGKPNPRARTTRQTQQQARRSPSDFVKFGNRCLHCGSEDHRAAACPVNKYLMAKNGGKLPAGYTSAFDKWKAKQPKSVNAITKEDVETDDDEEFAETASLKPLWSIPINAIAAQPVCQFCRLCTYEHPNSFADLFIDNDMDKDDEDENAMVNALNNITSQITIGQKMSQKDVEKSKPVKPFDQRTIASIPIQVRDGKLALPDLDFDSNDKYEAIWALVDAGAARSCAKRREHFQNTYTKLAQSSVKMATANGEELTSRGCFKIEAYSAEGNRITQTFEDADVDMPIMAVTELSENGALGSDIVFRKTDGAMVDVESDKTSRFIRRKGVYFMKIFVPKSQKNNSDFTQPGCA